MNSDPEPIQVREENEESSVYEAPRIESVMTAEALAREVQYAGTTDLTLPTG
jgi:hypothetical protein